MVGHPYKGSGRRDSGRLNRALHHPTELPLEASFSGLKLITTGVVSILYLSTRRCERIVFAEEESLFGFAMTGPVLRQCERAYRVAEAN
jgi:hypothetical protein